MCRVRCLTFRFDDRSIRTLYTIMKILKEQKVLIYFKNLKVLTASREFLHQVFKFVLIWDPKLHEVWEILLARIDRKKQFLQYHLFKTVLLWNQDSFNYSMNYVSLFLLVWHQNGPSRSGFRIIWISGLHLCYSATI